MTIEAASQINAAIGPMLTADLKLVDFDIPENAFLRSLKGDDLSSIRGLLENSQSKVGFNLSLHHFKSQISIETIGELNEMTMSRQGLPARIFKTAFKLPR